MENSQESWGEFLEKQLHGECSYGSWFNYIQEWNTFINQVPEKIFLAQFEQLREMPETVIKDLCMFLEKPHELVHTVAVASSFDVMKVGIQEKLRVESERLVKVKGANVFMLTGGVNYWKSKFTVDQSLKFNQFFTDFFKTYNIFADCVAPYL